MYNNITENNNIGKILQYIYLGIPKNLQPSNHIYKRCTLISAPSPNMESKV